MDARNGWLTAAAISGGFVVHSYHRLCAWWSPPPVCRRSPPNLGEICLTRIDQALAEAHSNRVVVGVCCGLICLVVSAASLVFRAHATTVARVAPRLRDAFYNAAAAEEAVAAEELFLKTAVTRKGPKVARQATGGLEALNAIQPLDTVAYYKPKSR